MPGVNKAIKNRIKSVSNTKKITKAMELVSAAKMRKAVESSLSSRLYAEHAWELLMNLSREQNLQHPLLENKNKGKVLIIIAASNRGLCGGYNSNILKKATNYLLENKDKEIDIITIGRKAEIIASKTNKKVVASFTDFNDDLHNDEIRPLSNVVIEEFEKGTYKQVLMIYTHFISGINYEPRIKSLLPINKESLAEILKEEVGHNIEKEKLKPLILFEPNEEMVLNLVLPRLTEVQIYQSLLEANASEHSARMLAMKNASDNASSMVDELMLYYNQSRQAAITQEIAEISGGAAALGN